MREWRIEVLTQRMSPRGLVRMDRYYEEAVVRTSSKSLTIVSFSHGSQLDPKMIIWWPNTQENSFEASLNTSPDMLALFDKLNYPSGTSYEIASTKDIPNMDVVSTLCNWLGMPEALETQLELAIAPYIAQSEVAVSSHLYGAGALLTQPRIGR